MDPVPDKQSDQCLLDAVLAFVATHPDPGVQRFRDSITNWGQEWKGVAPRHLPAANRLTETLSHTVEDTHALAALFEQERAWRKWEQSYTKADRVVSEDMLSGYGFAEVIGKHGPFLSTRVRSGIGIWGPNITYPPHQHAAEEVYVVLAGSAEFLLGHGDEAVTETRAAGEAVFVPSLLTHGFRTRERPLVVFYIWQAGDLREKSTFV